MTIREKQMYQNKIILKTKPTNKVIPKIWLLVKKQDSWLNNNGRLYNL